MKKLSEKKRKELLKSKYDLEVGDRVLFTISTNKNHIGTVMDYIEEGEYPEYYHPEFISLPDSRDKTCLWTNTDSVLICVMTGKNRDLPSYYNACRIIEKLSKTLEPGAK